MKLVPPKKGARPRRDYQLPLFGGEGSVKKGYWDVKHKGKSFNVAYPTRADAQEKVTTLREFGDIKRGDKVTIRRAGPGSRGPRTKPMSDGTVKAHVSHSAKGTPFQVREHKRVRTVKKLGPNSIAPGKWSDGHLKYSASSTMPAIKQARRVQKLKAKATAVRFFEKYKK